MTITPAAGPGWLRPAPAFRTVRRISWVTTSAVPGLGAVVAGALLGGIAGAAAGLMCLAVLVGLAFVTADRQYAAWGYAERGDDLLVRHGVLVRRLSAVPYGRMQFVDVQSGPLDRLLGIATVQLHTAAAASDARLPGLPTAEAERLRDRLAERGEARALGL